MSITIGYKIEAIILLKGVDYVVYKKIRIASISANSLAYYMNLLKI